MNWYRPAVMAGKFYPKEKDVLLKKLTKYYDPSEEKKHAMAIFVPHAGYMYSGKIAGAVYKKIVVPDTVIILSPNHTGRGPFLSFWDEGSWDTPLGKVHVDSVVAEKFRLACKEINSDMMAHLSEHAIEVQLPFLQYQNPKVKIVPLVLGPLRFDACKKVGEALAKTIGDRKDILIIVSTDMTHYLAADAAKEKDDLALEKILAMDAEGLYRTVANEEISMCGFVPMAVALTAVKILGASKAHLVSYGNSSDKTGDRTNVVSYASGYFN